MNNQKHRHIGIDATNIRAGGGVTHLVELLNNYAPPIGETPVHITVWGVKNVLDKIKKEAYIHTITPVALEGNFLQRIWWKFNHFDKAINMADVDVLFVPGGVYTGKFRPYVYMSQNMLVFDRKERSRYGISLMRVRLKLLYYLQSKTYRHASRAIFISDYAKRTIQKLLGPKPARIIHHGVSNRFSSDLPKTSITHPVKIVYVSLLDVYKHQNTVAEAVYNLNRKGIPIELTLVGEKFDRALKLFHKDVKNSDYIKFVGKVPFEDIDQYYKNGHFVIFASSCENMPNILIEAMYSRTPILCSGYHPMPEFLEDAGLYFDPLRVEDIEEKIRYALEHFDEMKSLAEKAYALANQYSWKRCANQTIDYLCKNET